MNNPKSKSIEELEKDIYKLDKESKTKIKEAIEKNKNLIIDIKSFNISDYPKFEKIFSVIETKIELFDENNSSVGIKKASELSGSSNLVFIRNSLNGQVTAKPNKSSIQLNNELHSND